MVDEREVDNNSQDEIDFSQNIDDICNENNKFECKKNQIDFEGLEEIKKSDESKKEQVNLEKEKENEVELDEDYTEVIKL